jgi:hypothetical protein
VVGLETVSAGLVGSVGLDEEGVDEDGVMGVALVVVGVPPVDCARSLWASAAVTTVTAIAPARPIDSRGSMLIGP